MAITIEKLKENFAKNGQTLAQWARENGFKPRDVYLVVGGQRKGNYGNPKHLTTGRLKIQKPIFQTT